MTTEEISLVISAWLQKTFSLHYTIFVDNKLLRVIKAFMRSDAKLINKIKTWTLDISAFFAISINILLIVLIITKSPKSIGAYKHLMIYIAFFELTYAISYVAEKPVSNWNLVEAFSDFQDIFTKGSAFLIITNTKESVFPVTLSIWLDGREL